MPGKTGRRTRWAAQICDRRTCNHQMLDHMHRDVEGRWVDMNDSSCVTCAEDLDDATRCHHFVVAEGA